MSDVGEGSNLMSTINDATIRHVEVAIVDDGRI